MNIFQKALLAAVLEEYAEPDGASQAECSVWIDREHRCLYRTRHDGCTQHLFPNQKKMDAYIRLLKMQGYSQK